MAKYSLGQHTSNNMCANHCVQYNNSQTSQNKWLHFGHLCTKFNCLSWIFEWVSKAPWQLIHRRTNSCLFNFSRHQLIINGGILRSYIKAHTASAPYYIRQLSHPNRSVTSSTASFGPDTASHDRPYRQTPGPTPSYVHFRSGAAVKTALLGSVVPGLCLYA